TYGVHNPISVIPNGGDLPQLTESSVAEPASAALRTFAQGRKILLYLGRLHPKKNFANLIRACEQSRNSHPSAWEHWALAVACWDQAGHERELKRLNNDYGLADSVRFLGPLFGQEKDAAYRACDAFVLPSLSEGLPMAVLEAWAYAKPVLMTP